MSIGTAPFCCRCSNTKYVDWFKKMYNFAASQQQKSQKSEDVSHIQIAPAHTVQLS